MINFFLLKFIANNRVLPKSFFLLPRMLGVALMLFFSTIVSGQCFLSVEKVDDTTLKITGTGLTTASTLLNSTGSFVNFNAAHIFSTVPTNLTPTIASGHDLLINDLSFINPSSISNFFGIGLSTAVDGKNTGGTFTSNTGSITLTWADGVIKGTDLSCTPMFHQSLGAIMCNPLIESIAVSNISACVNNTFTAKVVVSFYQQISLMGINLELSGDVTASQTPDQLFTSQAVFNDLTFTADGTPIDITAKFVGWDNCAFRDMNLGSAPAACFDVSVCQDDVVLTGQSQVDNFSTLYGGCTFINSVTIMDDNDGIDNITNITGLQGLTNIGTVVTPLRGNNVATGRNNTNGCLSIVNNPFLTDISGLANLRSILGDLIITGNPLLQNVDPLSQLTTIPGSLTITDNADLTSVDGLANVASIGGDLMVMDNAALMSTSSIGASVGGTTTIMQNGMGLTPPSIEDPCNCNNLLNKKDASGKITYFHDVLIVSGAAGQAVELTAEATNFLDASLSPIAAGNIGTIPTGGVFRLEFFHASEATGSIDVTVGGAALPTFPISVCKASTCTEPVPTMSQWGLLVFGLIILNLSLFFVGKTELS